MTTNGKTLGRGIAAVAALAVMLAVAPGSADAKVKRHLGLEQQAAPTAAGAQKASKGQKGARAAAAKHGAVAGTVVTRGGKVVRGSKVVVTRVSGRHVVHRLHTGPAGHFQTKLSPAVFRVTASKKGMGRSSTMQFAIAPGSTQNVQLRLKTPTHHRLAHKHHRFHLGLKGKAVDTAAAMNQRASQVPANPNANAPRTGTVAQPGPGTVANQAPGVINGGAAVNNPNAGRK